MTSPGSKRSSRSRNRRDSGSFGVDLDLAVLLGVGVLFVIAGAWWFSKIEV